MAEVLIQYKLLNDPNELTEVLQEYTCPHDGYIRAWQDSYNPLLVWVLPLCPIDPLIPGLKQLLAASISTRYEFTDQIIDRHQRILQIISGSIQDATDFLHQHAIQPIADFLSETGRLHAFIFAEVVRQGIIAEPLAPPSETPQTLAFSGRLYVG